MLEKQNVLPLVVFDLATYIETWLYSIKRASNQKALEFALL